MMRTAVRRRKRAPAPTGKLPQQMSKEEIVKAYTAATKSEQDAITAAARKWLASKGINVGRDSLRHWRNNPTQRSPLAPKYKQAYTHAMRVIAEKQTA